MHLTVNEIIEFVSMTELDGAAVRLSATVNGHIRKCKECRNLIRSFQMIYDEFSRYDTDGDFRKYITENILSIKDKNDELQAESVEMDF